MGSWANEARRQESALKKMTTEGALVTVAYWKSERDDKGRGWLPLTLKILRDAPKRTVQTPDWAANNRIAKFLFGSLTNPPVTADVRAEVLDYARKSAKILDKSKPDVTAPKFIPQERVKEAFKMASEAKFQEGKPRKSGLGAGAVLLLLLLAGGKK